MTSIPRASVQRVIKKELELKSVQQIHTQQMPRTSLERRVEQSRILSEAFNAQDFKMMCFQDEKDFTIQIPRNSQNDRVYTFGTKYDIEPARLFHHSNKFSEN